MQDCFDNSLELLLEFLQKREVKESEWNYQQIQLNSEKITTAIYRQLYSIEDESTKQSFIRNLHARLVWEIDYSSKIVSHPVRKENSKKFNNKLIETQKSALNILENLLNFILENFSDYCDWQQKLPVKFREEFTGVIMAKFNMLSFSENDLDSILFEKVKTSIKKKLEENQYKITYGLTIYLDKLFQEIEKIRVVNREYSHSVSLKDILIAFNFNSLTVVHYLVSTIVEDVKKIEPVKDKIERLNLWFKQVNQVPVNSTYSFSESREGVRQYLNNWIQEEIQFNEKSLFLFSGSYPSPLLESKRSNFKIETELPVTQIACFLRLFMDCGIFKKTNVREIINFLSEHMRSKKRENISSESFRLKYYNIEESTREEVRKLLFQMLDKSAHPL